MGTAFVVVHLIQGCDTAVAIRPSAVPAQMRIHWQLQANETMEIPLELLHARSCYQESHGSLTLIYLIVPEKHKNKFLL